MEDSGYCSRDSRGFEMCSASDSAHSIFNLQYTDLSTSEYSYFLYGFKDEADFEEFKQDLRDFQKLKLECCSDVVDGHCGSGDLVDLKELQFICRPNYLCKHRRGRASRNAKEFKQSPVMLSESAVKTLQRSLQACTSVVQADLSAPEVSQVQPCGLLRTERPDTSVLATEFDACSKLSGFDKDCGIEPIISDILTKFLNEDEHFKEFERVFETVRNRRISKDLDTGRRLSSKRDSIISRRLSSDRDSRIRRRVSSDADSCISGRLTSETDICNKLSLGRDSRACVRTDNESGDNISNIIQQSPSMLASDIFADFFDNDETFLEFEREFDKFKSNRQSSLLENLSNFQSSFDSFDDVRVHCDRSTGSKSGSGVNTNSCSMQVESYPRCGDAAGINTGVGRSVGDLETLYQKLRQNGHVSLNADNPDCPCHHRYSISALPVAYKQTGHHKTYSLSDLNKIHECHVRPYPSGQLSSRKKTDLIRQPAPLGHQGKQQSEPDFTRGNSMFPNLFGNDYDSSHRRWSEILNNSDYYTKSSAQCSSSSDFCDADLHIDEPRNNDLFVNCDLFTSTPPRRHSLMVLDGQSRSNALCLHTNSMESLRCSKEYRKYDRSPSDSNIHRKCNKTDNRQSGFTDLGDGSTVTGNSKWSRPPSAGSSHPSDHDSEYYHSATSDLSDRYSTAKSHVAIDKHGSGFNNDSVSFDLSEDLSSAVGLSYVLDWTSRQEDSNSNHELIHRRGYPRYNQGEGQAKYTFDRPLSGSACNYTCHEHCLPAVTLSCKSISSEGFDIITSRPPDPSDPRSHNINARPGGARMVSSWDSNTTYTTPVRAAHASESAPNFQQIAEGGRGELDHPHQNFGHKHMDTPRPLSLSPSHRSWSISEDFVTAHSFPAPHPGRVSGPGSYSSQEQLIPSPQCLPSHSDSQASSLHHKDVQFKTHSASYSPESVSHGGITDVTQGNGRSTSVTDGSTVAQHVECVCDADVDFPKDNSALDFPCIYRPDEETNPEATTEKDETDSGYRSGTIPDDKLPRVPSQTTLDQQELQRKVAKYNHFVPAVNLEVTGKESFQGFLKVTLNLIRPITMELGARPPSIYELLTREHIIEENTQQVAFYMPRDTHKSLHITSDTTTKEVITSLLKKFHILDHPRKFAMYDQEFSDRNKLVCLRRLTDKDYPLRAMVNWDPERIKNYRMVLQENETGEIVWDAFSLPELNNFLRVLEREEKETIKDLKHKYAYMKQYMERRLVELRTEKTKTKT